MDRKGFGDTLSAKALLLIGSLMVAITGAEIAARLVFPEWRSVWSQGFLRFDAEIGTLVGRENFRGRQTNLYGEYNVSIVLNENGFRTRAISGAIKPELVFFGDSFGFGWGVEEDQSYAAVASRIVSRPFANLSVPATDLSDYLLLARRFRALLADSCVVVLVTFENDVLSYAPVNNGSVRRQLPVANAAYKWTVENFALASVTVVALQRSDFIVRLARRLGILAPSGSPQSGERDSVMASVEMLAAMRNEAAAAAQFIVLLVPPRPRWNLGSEYRRFIETLRRQGFEVLDPGIDDGDFFPFDGHWTAQAHARVGTLLARLLRERSAARRQL